MGLALAIRRRLTRWRRAAPGTATRAWPICSVFAVLIVTGVYAAKEHTTLFRSAKVFDRGGLPGAAAGDGGAKAPALVGHSELDPSDPVMRFSETRVGQVLFSSPRSDNCQRLLFDNRTGAYHEAKEVFCGQKAEEEAETERVDRIAAVRRSFKK